MSSQDKYDVVVDGKIITRINSKLVEEKQISDSVLNKIKNLHITKYRIFEIMEDLPDDMRRILINYAYQVEEVEFALQELWGFEKNSDYHKWYEVPKCTCPSIDNRERYGTPYRVISENCPVHGRL